MKKIERKKGQKYGVKKGQISSKIVNAKHIKSKNIKWLVGIDEVGRGPLAGPVAVCACAIPYHTSVKESYKKFLKNHKDSIKKLNLVSLTGKDSKKLKASEREAWKYFIDSINIRYSYSDSSAQKIDTIGIAACIRNLIGLNLKNLSAKHAISEDEAYVLLDGALRAPSHYLFQQTIIKGDEKELVISLASIIAKVIRDEHMRMLSGKTEFSVYGFDIHKGYGTPAHCRAIRQNGLSVQHRKSFCKNFAKG